MMTLMGRSRCLIPAKENLTLSCTILLSISSYTIRAKKARKKSNDFYCFYHISSVNYCAAVQFEFFWKIEWMIASKQKHIIE